MLIHKKVNKTFFKKWTPEMSYVLGFFAADGYITVNKRGGQFLCIQIIDKKLLINIKKVLSSEHRIGIRLPRKPKESILYRIQIGSIEMCNDLRNLGFTERKTKNLVIPKIPKKLFPHFVRGYFDGDGNVWQGEIHKDRKTRLRVLKITFTSCSNYFLENLKIKLKLYNIENGCIYRSKTKEFSRLQYSTNNALKLYDFMYNTNIKDFKGLFLDRKKKIFEKYIRLRL